MAFDLLLWLLSLFKKEAKSSFQKFIIAIVIFIIIISSSSISIISILIILLFCTMALFLVLRSIRKKKLHSIFLKELFIDVFKWNLVFFNYLFLISCK